MLTATDVAILRILQDALPYLEPHDRDHVLAYAVALQTSGIPRMAQESEAYWRI